jgi:hypothetical protein
MSVTEIPFAIRTSKSSRRVGGHSALMLANGSVGLLHGAGVAGCDVVNAWMTEQVALCASLSMHP